MPVLKTLLDFIDPSSTATSSAQGILDSYINPELEGIRFIFIFFSLLFLAATIYFYKTTGYLEDIFFRDFRDFWTFKPKGEVQRADKWKKVDANIHSGIPAEEKLAIIDAIEMIEDYFFTYYDGDNFKEWIEEARRRNPSIVPAIERLKDIKQKIVEDKNYELSSIDAKNIVKEAESVLRKIKHLV